MIYLTEKQMESVVRRVRDSEVLQPDLKADIIRLIGEVRELRDREASVSFMHGLEG